MLCSFIEIKIRHGYPPANLLHIFRTDFSKNTSGRLLLNPVVLIWCRIKNSLSTTSRSTHPRVFLEKSVLKIRSKYAGANSCRGVISINLLYNFNEIALPHGCSPVNLLHIFRTPFPKTPLDGCFWTFFQFQKQIHCFKIIKHK